MYAPGSTVSGYCGAHPQHHRRAVRRDRRLAVALDGRGEQPVALGGAAQPGEGRAGPQPGVGREQVARLDVQLVALEVRPG